MTASHGTVEQLENAIEVNPSFILPVLRESRPIFNGDLLEKYRNARPSKKSLEKFIETTESSLAITQRLLELQSELPSIIYPLILRLRAVYLTEALLDGKEHSTMGFMELLFKAGFSRKQASELIAVFRCVRGSKPAPKTTLSHQDMIRLFDVVEDSYQRVGGKWEKLA
ncbi:hypothetical protein HYV84_01060 [Candidatus Woesearchaeota archaeon]|nr:hypothetical protein [Candidatus Woesearchaeota archaeon]